MLHLLQVSYYLVVCQPKIARFGLGKGERERGKELKPFPFTPYPLPRLRSIASVKLGMIHFRKEL